MSPLLSEIHEASCDEPPPISPLLVVEPPIPTAERLVLRNGRVLLIVEEEGGAEVSVTDFGRLSESLYYDVPERFWLLLDEWIDREADAIPYADLVAEQLKRY